MIVVLKPNITRKEEQAVLKEIRKLGYKPHIMRGVARTVVGAIGDERKHHTLETLTAWPQVENVMPVQKRFKLVSREAHRTDSTVNVRGTLIGGKKIQMWTMRQDSLQNWNVFTRPLAVTRKATPQRQVMKLIT